MTGAGERTPSHEATVTVAAAQTDAVDQFRNIARKWSIKGVNGTKIDP